MLNIDDMRSDQVSCVDELYSSDATFVVMRMGGGKTATALTAASELIRDGHRRRGVIIAPPLVSATVWVNEVAKWSHLSGVTIESAVGLSPAKRLDMLKKSTADFIAFSDGVVPWLVKTLLRLPDNHPRLDMLMYDEPKLKNPRGAIGKALVKVAPRIKTIWFLSGTPRPNGYEDLFMPSRVLTGNAIWGKSFDDWRRRNFMALDYNGYDWAVHEFRKPQLDKDINTFMSRAAEPKDGYKSNLCTGAEFDFEFDLEPEARKQYKKMLRDLIMELTGERYPTEALIVAMSQAIASSKLSQLAQGFVYETTPDGGAPVPHVVHEQKKEILRYQLDAIGAENTILCYGFRADVTAIREVLDKDGRKYGILGQGVSTAQRVAYCDAWNDGKLDNLIMHPASAGHGIELQHGGRRMIWYCPTWSAEQYDQTVKRIDRHGQTQQVYNHQIIARDTVDVVKRNRVQYKMTDQEAFKDLLRTL